MNNVDDILAQFRTKNPFTYLPPEVIELVKEAYDASRGAGED